MRGLTGIVALDVVEWIGIAALVAFAVRQRSRVWQAAAGATVLGAAFITGAGTLPVFLAAAAGMGMVVAIASDARARWIAARVLVVGIVLCLPAAFVALTSRGESNQAKARLSALRDDLTADDPSQAASNLERTRDELVSIHDRLGGPLTAPAKLVPFVSQQVRAADELLGAVLDVVVTAKATVADVNLHDLHVEDGRVPVARISSLAEPAKQLEVAAAKAKNVAAKVAKEPLVPQLRHLTDEATKQATRSERSASLVHSFASNAANLFGANGTRRYFLLVQNPSEARASGGILGAFAEITVKEGRLELTRVGRDNDLNELSGNRPRPNITGFERELELQPNRYWQNFTASPDFPTVAKVIEAEYAPIAQPIDGVISVDPAALAALLKIAGPVTTAHWPVPLTADNVVAILEHDQYVRFADNAPLRELFMAEATGAIWKHATTSSLQLDQLDALSDAVNGGHIQLHSTHAEEQQLFTRSGIAGEFPHDTGTDVLSVVTRNMSGNKIDWFLHRDVTYDAHIDGDTITAKVKVTLRNDAPTSGEPLYVAGFKTRNENVGLNRTLLSIYTPWKFEKGEIGLPNAPLLTSADQGLNVYSVQLNLAPGATTTVELELTGKWNGPADSYALAYRPQALVNKDSLRVSAGQSELQELVTRPFGSNSSLRWYGLPS